MQRSTTVRKALSSLPPDITDAFKKNGFEAVRVEASGALRLSISNDLPIEVKTLAVRKLRTVLQDYGLDLVRSMGAVSATSVLDQSCLVTKHDANGIQRPLFRQNGDPYPEMEPRQLANSCNL